MTIFLNNKYSVLYDKLIARARNRKLSGYVERHHIIPRSMGGGSFENIVELTAREHFICHALLVKMTEGDAQYKMVNALMWMCVSSPDHSRYVNSRLYNSARHIVSLMRRDPILDHSRRKKISLSHKALPKKTLTEEWKRRIGESSKGRHHTTEHKQHMSNYKSNFWAKKKELGLEYPTLTCLYCNKSGRGPNMTRYHFSNCKHKEMVV